MEHEVAAYVYYMSGVNPVVVREVPKKGFAIRTTYLRSMAPAFLKVGRNAELDSSHVFTLTNVLMFLSRISKLGVVRVTLHLALPLFCARSSQTNGESDADGFLDQQQQIASRAIEDTAIATCLEAE